MLPAAAAGLVFACAHDYRDPDPAAGSTARVVIENPSADSVYISMDAAAVHVYERAPECTRTYLGTVSVADLKREILVAADRPVLFHFSINVLEARRMAICDTEIGFTPRAGATYRLIAGEHFRQRCSLQVLNSSGEQVPAFDPSECEGETMRTSSRFQ
jgi:hypothetical protein